MTPHRHSLKTRICLQVAAVDPNAVVSFAFGLAVALVAFLVA
jgi:hypothetical protein